VKTSSSLSFDDLADMQFTVAGFGDQ